MCSEVIVIDLVAGQYWRVHFLHASYDFLALTNFSVHHLHLVIVHVALSVNCSVCLIRSYNGSFA